MLTKVILELDELAAYHFACFLFGASKTDNEEAVEMWCKNENRLRDLMSKEVNEELDKTIALLNRVPDDQRERLARDSVKVWDEITKHG